MKNRGKSLGMNAFLNCLKSILSVIFPLITYPYVLRVLQVENIGRVDFSNSIVNYFVLLAGLGINTYAIREGAPLKSDKKKLSAFASEMFTINFISSLITIIVLFMCIIMSYKLQEYKNIIIIQSLTIIGNLLGVLWLYIIMEDYVYITMRAIIVHIIALLLVFIYVRDQNDYLAYAAASVIANVGANFFNFYHVRKYVNLHITKKVNVNKHMKPIFVIFVSTIASTIYVNSDKTLLGILSNDYHVGLYSAAVSVYIILKICMIAVIQVSLPRLSKYIIDKDTEKYKESATYIFKMSILLLLPSVIGTFVVSKDIIIIIGGVSYTAAASSLKILSVSLIFSILATFYTNAVLLPFKEEKVVMKATIISAVVNVALNIILLRKFHQIGAAITTLIAEMIMFLYQYKYSKRYLKLNIDYKYFMSICIGCVGIVIISVIINSIVNNCIVALIAKIVLSIIFYILSMVVQLKAFDKKIIF